MTRLSGRHTRPRVWLLGVCSAFVLLVGLGAGIAFAAGDRGAGGEAAAKPNVTVVTVTAGKPSELRFKLSKSSRVPVGTVTFKVTNMGVAFHDFKVCARPVANAAAEKNACVGKKTRTLKHGESATLTLKISKTGKYEFLCTVTGHAAAGMKGLVGVGVALTPSDTKPVTTTTTTSTTTSTTPVSNPGEIGPAVGCPPGVTVKASGNADADGDELGTEPDDQDGCV